MPGSIETVPAPGKRAVTEEPMPAWSGGFAKPFRRAAFPWALGLALAALVARAAPVSLVDEGRPVAAVVFADGEPQAEKAAGEIARYVEKMSGAKLPVAAESAAGALSPPNRVLVGHTREAEKLGVAVPKGFDPSVRPGAFEEEGYALKTLPSRVVVGGNSDGPYLGTLYAAYALLERLGCRWYFPGEWGEIVPARKSVAVPDLDATARPAFAVRMLPMMGQLAVTKEELAEYGEWAVKAGLNHGETYPSAGDGFLALLLPTSEYKQAHPEYYAMREDGTRRLAADKAGKINDRNVMLCLSNPAVLAECLRNLGEAFAGRKKLRCVTERGFAISPPDGAPFCFCDACRAANQNFNYPNYVHERMQGEEFFGFAAKLAKAFPDRWAGVMAYSNREMPPQGVEIPPNTSVKLASISCCVIHPANDPSCWRRQEMMRLLRQWRALTPHVIVRDYSPGFLNWIFLPERDMANLPANLAAYQAAGAKGLMREGRKAFMQTWLGYWLTGKLLWDPKADAAALKRGFYADFFGPAAGPHVQAWWDGVEAALLPATIHAHENWLVNRVYTTALARKLHAHAEAAAKAEMAPDQRKRFDAFALIADHFEAYAAMEEAERALDYPGAAREAERMLEDVRKLAATDRFLIGFKIRENPSFKFTEGRKRAYEELAAKTRGPLGKLAAPLPLEMKFRRDPFNEGVVAEWYAPGFADAGWGTKDTFFLWEQQDPPEDAAGHDWDGHGWYRARVGIPKEFAGKPLRLWLGGAINEAWVWVNGKYAGHKPHRIWWRFPHELDLDVASLVKPGEDNTVAVRVLNTADVGGLFRRGFFWSPADGAVPPAVGKAADGGEAP
jgi:hypothetical protein